MLAFVLLSLLAQSLTETPTTFNAEDAGAPVTPESADIDAGTADADDARGFDAGTPNADASGPDAGTDEQDAGSAFKGAPVPGLGDSTDAPMVEPTYTPPPLESAQGYDMAGGQGQDRDTPAFAVTDGGTPPPKFVKGELSVFLGADRLVTKNNRVGVSVGIDLIGADRPEDAANQRPVVFYMLLEPQVDLRFLEENKLAIGLGVPLRLELLNFGTDPATGQTIGTNNLFALRKEDYDQPSDFARVLKYVTYGAKEDRLYVNVGQRYASSIGHGALVRRYAPNIDVDQARVSAQVDAYNDYAGFELLTNDVVEWNLLSGLVFVKPLSFFTDNALAKSLSVGGSIATDLKAPSALRTNAVGGRTLDRTGHLTADTRPVTLVGVDAELKVIKTATADIKPYVDYSVMTGGGGGLTIGALGRFNFGTDVVNAFRVVVEGRSLDAQYQPSYFDTFYEVERYIARELPRTNPSVANFATKQQDVLSGRLGQRLGYYVEASYGIRKNVGVTLALEGTNNSAEKNLVAHLEVPALDFLQFFGSYYKRGFTSFSDVTKADARSVFFAGARLRVLPFLFINGRAFKTFRVNPDVQRYDNSFGFAVDLEIGYEFKKTGKTEAVDLPPVITPLTEEEERRLRESPPVEENPTSPESPQPSNP